MIKPATNYVLVEPLGYQPLDQRAGLVVHEEDNAHRLQAQVGIVRSVCDRLQYDGDELHGYMDGRRLSDSEQRYSGYMTSKTVYYDVPIEVKDGDMVLYRWKANTEEAMRVDDMLLIRYDNLVARVDGLDKVPYPLNGLLLLRMEKENVDDVLQHQARMRQGMARVIAEGCLVRSYLLFPGEVDERLALLGREVVFDRRLAVRIEHDDHAYLTYDSEYPYYGIRRHAIDAIVL